MEKINLLGIAINASILAWKSILDIYNKDDFDKILKKDNSPVTKADLLSNDILIKELGKTWIEIISEEKENINTVDANNGIVWLVDPIDWTKDFINKTWEFSIMIWLLKNLKPVIWVVYLPSSDVLYYAEKWKWSFVKRNNEITRLKVSDNDTDISILISRNHTTKIELEIIEKMKIKNKIPCWSIGVKLWKIAEKKWDLYLNLSDKTHIWDTCAPEVILKEAWWSLTDKYWDNIDYNKTLETKNKNWLIASNWIIHLDTVNFLKINL